ncbi:hypothetical protein I2501_12400 [Streptacidiphilus sp. NEAU-YB345]|uniref:HNH endonuclease n=1 Tax=Streptacidiphilus fuscans TaxID=2789292 RepID=A0A931FFW3_9ACTN|nr:hypothetical protein [Streptacidiphilus fuscans]MBF9068824.1 hypothetical protein [Streptacidiphilus fuscans]
MPRVDRRRTAPARLRGVLLAVPLLLCAACGSGTSVTPAAPGSAGGGAALAVGPGPQQEYRVAAQPAAGSCRYGSSDGQPLPDPRCTPGAVNPAVTQSNLRQTLCRRGGYTAGVRPPRQVTDAEKRLNARSYGYTGRLSDAEYDHLVPLGVGGDPNDPRNLWVEPPSPGHVSGSGTANPKDDVESALHDAVCSGQVSLQAAQRAVASNWTTALSSLGVTAEK